MRAMAMAMAAVVLAGCGEGSLSSGTARYDDDGAELTAPKY